MCAIHNLSNMGSHCIGDIMVIGERKRNSYILKNSHKNVWHSLSTKCHFLIYGSILESRCFHFLLFYSLLFHVYWNKKDDSLLAFSHKKKSATIIV